MEDLDTFNFRCILGRGNFGMVYRGVVKNLKTPARSDCSVHANIPAAIKVTICSMFEEWKLNIHLVRFYMNENT